MLVQKIVILIFSLFIAFVKSATIGKLLQVPDKDPTLKVSKICFSNCYMKCSRRMRMFDLPLGLLNN